MTIQKNFGIIGGDFRQIYLAERFLSSGAGSILWGFNKLNNSKLLMQPPELSNLISNSEYVILPLPITRDGATLNAPFSDEKIELNEEFWSSLERKVVFGGMISSIKSLPKIKIYDYSEREEFKILNAIPSAEGAIKIALDQSSKTLFGSKCFVAGFGRIGKILSDRLKKFGAEVTVSARKSSDLAWIKALGYKPLVLNKSTGNLDYDFIFNTIPYIVFDSDMLAKCSKNAVVVDLASAPGGIDDDAARMLGFEYIHALGIPGKLFSKSASDIIYDTIKNILAEENL